MAEPESVKAETVQTMGIKKCQDSEVKAKVEELFDILAVFYN